MEPSREKGHFGFRGPSWASCEVRKPCCDLKQAFIRSSKGWSWLWLRLRVIRCIRLNGSGTKNRTLYEQSGLLNWAVGSRTERVSPEQNDGILYYVALYESIGFPLRKPELPNQSQCKKEFCPLAGLTKSVHWQAHP